MFGPEAWHMPLILLPGVALLIVSTSARAGDVHAEFHRLLDRPEDRAKIVSENLFRRSQLLRNALVSLYASVSFFAVGSLLGGMISIWIPDAIFSLVALEILGIGCLVFASMQLIRESSISLRSVREHTARIERDLREQKSPSAARRDGES